MKLRILGSGTSTGVPEIGCTCKVCTSTDPHDKRLRTSAMLCGDDVRILIDCGPDFREQMLRMNDFSKIDAVLITHEHYDHVGGIDDLRPFCRFGEIPIYAEAYTANHLCERLPYCLIDKVYPGVPRIYLNEIQPNIAFHVHDIEVLPFRVMHGHLPMLTVLDYGVLRIIDNGETIKTAKMAEVAIVYGNRYRVTNKDVDFGLIKAENMFFKGNFKNSLENAINAINIVEPGIHKRLLEEYR